MRYRENKRGQITIEAAITNAAEGVFANKWTVLSDVENNGLFGNVIGATIIAPANFVNNCAEAITINAGCISAPSVVNKGTLLNGVNPENQEEIVPELSKFGFTTVNQSVMRFDFQDENAVNTLREKSLPRLNNGFAISLWDDKYFNSAAELIHNSFRKMSDAKFDPRFSSVNGVKDIIAKITNVCEII